VSQIVTVNNTVTVGVLELWVEGRGRDRKEREEEKRGEGKVKDGCTGACGCQRGDCFH